MDSNKTIKQTIIATVVCIVYLLLTIFHYHIDKFLTGVIFVILTLLIPATFIAILVSAIKEIIQIIRNRANLTFKLCLPTIILLTTLAYAFLSPWQLDSESLESKVEMRACHEGTQNTSSIKFRVDHSFEVHHVSFGSSWNLGKWRKNADTLFMKFNTYKDNFLSDTIIIQNEYLIPIREINLVDSLKHYHRYYYLGYCKNLN